MPRFLRGAAGAWRRRSISVIAIGFRREALVRYVETVEPAGRIPNPYNLRNEEPECPEIFLCRELAGPWPEFWTGLRSFG